MLEMKITVAAPDLAAAINNLAAALEGKAPHTVCNQHGNDNKHIDNVGTVNFGATPGVQAPVNPTQPAAPGVPQSAGVAPTATPAQPTMPVTPTVQAPINPTPAVPVVNSAPAPSPAPVANAVTPQVPTGAPTYTLDMIAKAGTALVDAGKMDALIGLLSKYQVEALTALDPTQYGNFATELRALGAQI